MAAISTIVTIASLAATAYGMQQQAAAQEEARKAQEQANSQQKQAQAEQKAAQAAQAAQERRQQLREERVKRAQILQASSNTGVMDSSGAVGAAGNLSTQLSSNIGYSAGQRQAAANISDYNQNAADLLSAATNKINEANQWGQVAGFGMNIFQQAGGFNAFKTGTQAPAPVSTATPKSLF